MRAITNPDDAYFLPGSTRKDFPKVIVVNVGNRGDMLSYVEFHFDSKESLFKELPEILYAYTKVVILNYIEDKSDFQSMHDCIKGHN